MAKEIEVDLESIDSLLGYKTTGLDNKESSSSTPFLGFNSDYSTVVDSINRMKQNLEDKNIMKEFSEVIISDKKIKVPTFGKFGKVFGIYHEVTQKTEEKIIRRLGLEEAMPRIIQKMNDYSSDLGEITNKLKEVIKSREKSIGKMELDVCDNIKAYNIMKLKSDELVSQITSSKEHMSTLDDYLGNSSYADENYCKLELKKVALKKHTKEMENDWVVFKKVINDKEMLKNRIEGSMYRSIEENKGLELYVRTANNIQQNIDHQNRESSMSYSAIYTLASQMTKIAYVGGEMIKHNRLNLDLVDSLNSLNNGLNDDSKNDRYSLTSLKNSIYDKVKELF